MKHSRAQIVSPAFNGTFKWPPFLSWFTYTFGIRNPHHADSSCRILIHGAYALVYMGIDCFGIAIDRAGLTSIVQLATHLCFVNGNSGIQGFLGLWSAARSMGKLPDSKVRGANVGAVRAQVGPCWPHEPCYLGYLSGHWSWTLIIWTKIVSLMALPGSSNGTYYIDNFRCHQWRIFCQNNYISVLEVVLAIRESNCFSLQLDLG